jgi:hypothetical protein
MTEPIKCACGCGMTINRLDPKGRPRRFLNGHNSRTPEWIARKIEQSAEADKRRKFRADILGGMGYPNAK